MFEWLEKEINEIKTRHFHVVDGPAGDVLREAVERSELALPRSYKEFVLRFGNAKLYKQLSYYIVGILASPIEEISKETGETFHRFGHYQADSAYFKLSLMHRDLETPVFEGGEEPLRQVGDGFESWLRKRCTDARRSYKKNRWAGIVAGPAPFTAEERTIVQARKRFACRVVGVASDGKLRFEAFNGSDTVLPFLSVGIRRKDGGFQGGIWLPVSHVRPKETAIIEHDCYSKLVTPSEIETYQLPDPEPEDRERYWEFKAFSP
jgi:hypothetical protein